MRVGLDCEKASKQYLLLPRLTGASRASFARCVIQNFFVLISATIYWTLLPLNHGCSTFVHDLSLTASTYLQHLTTSETMTRAHSTTTALSTITLLPSSLYTIPPTATTPPQFACDTYMQLRDNVPENAVGLAPLDNDTFTYLENCCNGAPIVAYQDGCAAFCTARSQDVNRLQSCVTSAISTGTADDIWGWQCNGCGTSTSSGSTTATGETTATASGTVTATPTRSSSAAAPRALRGGSEGVSKMALALTSTLGVSVLFGALML